MITVNSIPSSWLAATAGMFGVVALVLLLWLQQQRRLLIGDPQRRHFFIRYVQRRERPPGASARPSHQTVAVEGVSVALPSIAEAAEPMPTRDDGVVTEIALQPAPAPDESAITSVAPQHVPTRDQAVIYVDAAGRCTFANDTARSILHWTTEELALGDVLAGGPQEATGLLECLARQGFVAQHTTTLVGLPPRSVEITAVAFRDRDGSLWGAALFIHPQPVSSATAADLLSARSRQ